MPPIRLAAHTRRPLARALVCLPLLLVWTGCTTIPRDPDETLARVRASRSFRVGLMSPHTGAPVDPHVHDFLGRVGKVAGAVARVEGGAAEHLLTRLEAGELDLVIGALAGDSPWADRVTVLPPLRGDDDAEAIVPRAVVRHGENAWIALLWQQTAAPGARMP